MDCAAVKPRMEALVNGSLPPSEREPAEQHIAMCEGCRLELELVRAIGSQEKAPGVAKDDWTLDRIFGAEGGPGKGGEPAPAGASAKPPDPSGPPPSPFPSTPPSPSESPFAPEPLAPPKNDDGSSAHVESIADPSPFAAAMTPTAPPSTPSPESADEPSSSGSKGATTDPPAPATKKRPTRPAASWDFEPAEANASTKVPEESLFFATEALGRRKDPEVHRGSNLRVLLWGAGGLIGAILLAFSSWFVLHMNSSEDSGTKDEPGFNLEEPENPGTSQPPAGGETQPAQPAQPETSDEPDQTAQGATPAPAPEPAPSPSPSTDTTPPPVTRSSTSGQSFTTPAPSGPTQRVTTPKPAGSQQAPSPRSQRIVPEPLKPSPRFTTQPREYEPEPHIFGITPSPPRAHEMNDDDLGPPPEPTPAPKTAPKTTQKAPPPEPVKPTQETPPPTPAPDTPIQRLHLATVDAEERGDLVDLRRLRAAWKEFMSKVVGPDRARAKREYADCLWAIQSITGKRGDQKDTLAAYRDYLLSAPAGGADNRSASRMRQLEEAFTEKR